MAELKLSVSEMKELLDKMSALGLQKITVAQGDFTFKAEARQPAQTVCVTPDAQIIPAVPAAEAPAQAVSQKAEAPAGNVVKSPIVGTYYSQPAPDKEPFVSVAQG